MTRIGQSYDRNMHTRLPCHLAWRPHHAARQELVSQHVLVAARSTSTFCCVCRARCTAAVCIMALWPRTPCTELRSSKHTTRPYLCGTGRRLPAIGATSWCASRHHHNIACACLHALQHLGATCLGGFAECEAASAHIIWSTILQPIQDEGVRASGSVVSYMPSIQASNLVIGSLQG